MFPALRCTARAVVLAGAPFLAHAASPSPALTPADRSFIASVGQGGMFEVRAGQLALNQASTQDLRDQGATEAHDHKLVGDKLTAIAQAAGLTLPDTLTPGFTAELDALKARTGTAFDAAYLTDMEAIHAKDGAAFAKEATTGGTADLRAFAAETHRIVLRHVGELKALPAP